MLITRTRWVVATLTLLLWLASTPARAQEAGMKRCEARPGCNYLVSESQACSTSRFEGGSCTNGLLEGQVVTYAAKAGTIPFGVRTYKGGKQYGPSAFWMGNPTGMSVDSYDFMVYGDGSNAHCIYTAAGSYKAGSNPVLCQSALAAFGNLSKMGARYSATGAADPSGGVSNSSAEVAQSGDSRIIRQTALPVGLLSSARKDSCLKFRFVNPRAPDGTLIERKELISANTCDHPIVVIGRACVQDYVDEKARAKTRLPLGAILSARVVGPYSGTAPGAYVLGPKAERSGGVTPFASNFDTDVRVENLVYAAFGPPIAVGTNPYTASSEFEPVGRQLVKFEAALKSLGWGINYTQSWTINPAQGGATSCKDVDLVSIWNQL